MFIDTIARKINTFSTAVTICWLAIISLISRGIFLLKADVWHDEGYSTMIINQPIGEIIARTVNDVHPPFYYIVLHIWQSIFGSSVISLRGLSVVCGVLAVLLLYLLLKRLFSENIARLGALLAAIGPFLVRYSDEMRMYSLATLLAVAATLLLVVAMQEKTRKKWLIWTSYGLIIAAGLYTQYFFVFLVPVHALYALQAYDWKIRKLISDRGWWLGNLLAGGLFLLWLPTMLDQMSRVQQGFWIPPVNLYSIPNTISHFMTYNNDLTALFGYTLLLGVIIVPLIFFHRKKQLLRNTWLLAMWLLVPIICVTLLSLSGRPVYIDRYFSYSAPAFYALLALATYSPRFKRRPWVRPLLIVAICSVLVIGIFNVGRSATHQMGRAAEVVNQSFRKGDLIVSAELYTFFDFSYYNKTGEPVHLLSEKPFGRYGEYSLLHDKPELRISTMDSISAKRVWIIGKTGQHDYFTTMIPDSWKKLSTEFNGGDTAIRLYEVK